MASTTNKKSGNSSGGAERERARTAQSFCVPKADIAGQSALVALLATARSELDELAGDELSNR